MAVFVLDKRKKPLMPCSEKRARLLLERGRAVVHRMRPFTIRLKDRTVEESTLQPIQIKIDPGSKTTGVTVIREDDNDPEHQQVLMLMEIEHRGQRIKDTLTCHECNQAKGNQPVATFLADDPKGLQRIKAQAKAPLKDAAAVNSTRWALFRQLQATDLPVTTGSGGRTKFNRRRLGIPKTHALDAACVGPVTAITHWNVPTLTVRATGRGSYQRTRLNRFGFPRGYLMRQKQVNGFQTGDMVEARVPTGKKAGTYQGRVAIRATGSFNIQTRQGVVQGISHRHCRLLQRSDGYGYTFQPKPIQEDASRAA